MIECLVIPFSFICQAKNIVPYPQVISMIFLILVCFVLLRGPGLREPWTAIHHTTWDQSLGRKQCCWETRWEKEGGKENSRRDVLAFYQAPARKVSRASPSIGNWFGLSLYWICWIWLPCLRPTQYTHTEIDFMWFCGQYCLQSKAVDLWASARRPAFSLISPVCLPKLIFTSLKASTPSNHIILTLSLLSKFRVLNELDQFFCFQFRVIWILEGVDQFVLKLRLFNFFRKHCGTVVLVDFMKLNVQIKE